MGIAPIHAQGQGVILGNDTQQRQARLVDGVVNGGVELPEELLPHPVHHQMEGPGRKAIQLHDRMLGVPQGGGVRCGDHHAAVGTAGGQLKAGAQARRRVQQAEVISPADLLQEGGHLGLRHRAAPQPGRGGEEEEPWDFRMLHSGQVQGTAVLGHVGEIHQRPVGEAQGQVQVPQADVAVQTQDPAAGQCQRRAHSRRKGGFAGAALPGDHGDTLSPMFHDGGTSSPIGSQVYYKGFFLIFANILGYFSGVFFTFFTRISRCRTSVPGMA